MKFHNPLHPPPAPPGYGSGKLIPEESASILSRIMLFWLDPLIKVGFSRPLETDDLWKLPPNKHTGQLADKLENAFYMRCPPEKRPFFLRESVNTSRKKCFGKGSKPETYDSSLPRALYDMFFWRWWLVGLLTLVAQTLLTTTPLLNQVIFTWLAESSAYAQLSDAQRTEFGIDEPKGVGYGIGLAIALFAMQEIASLATVQYLQVGMSMGLCMRAGIVGCITRKSLRLSGRARIEHNTGQIMTMISTDSARLDQFCITAHQLWVAPIQLIVGIGLLIKTMGYSAVVGLGVLIAGFPIQTLLVIALYKQRSKGVKITDARIRLTTEVLQGIRLLKFYAWESFYSGKISGLRRAELETVKKSAVAAAALVASVSFVPIVASLLSFVTYSLTGHDLNVAIIFTALQFFNVIRTPLISLPAALGSLSDMIVATGRISKFLLAEEQAEQYAIDWGCKNAIVAEGDFTWESLDANDGHAAANDEVSNSMDKDAEASGDEKTQQGETEPELSATEKATDKTENDGTTLKSKDEPFKLMNLKLTISKGAFVAIVGRVGSGKSSILKALLGEMRRLKGQVVFGGSVAYVPQTAWIMNATLRENIVFGQEDNEATFRKIVEACSLTHDLDMLPQGENTEIGEKGINLSGGQKARVSLARAAYTASDIVLLDDPLSAVDAYVGKEILDNCLLSGPLASKTRIVVSHALHFLNQVDYIYVVDDGIIKEEGTFQDLMNDSVLFSHLITEYGQNQESTEAEVIKREDWPASLENKEITVLASSPLMQAEERNTGAVTWETYEKYFRFAGSIMWAPLILILLALVQSSDVGTTLLLGFWTAGSIRGFAQGDYIALYAGLGAAQAIFTFVLTLVFAYVGMTASLTMFKIALSSVLRSPVSFFDTTPMGRILSRFSKDQDTLDTQLPLNMMQFLLILSSVLGTIGLVFYVFPILGAIFAPMLILYYITSIYYRRTSVEIKRLDSISRSTFYSSFSETLTGVATVRAYRREKRALTTAEDGLDAENRAYYITVTLQRWLAVRQDLFSNILILGIALFAAGFRTSVNTSKIAVVLSYTLSITQIFSHFITQFAENEQNMNAAERLIVYTELPAEAGKDKGLEPPSSWPEKGEIKFTDVDLVYREGLPQILKGVSFHIKPGEKVGIVGRTGAGKSSLLQALFRIVEVQQGKIEIDGQDIALIRLDTLRSRLALVPQECTLFLGTLRENLDPLGSRTDADLISVLQRASLLPKDGTQDPTAEAKFSLDCAVGDEGSNYSAGEKQLLALCRALVRASRVIVLDEATSSVDVETDAKLQKAIQTEFVSSTLLCIAHRLNTIAHYDRVLVMDDGRVAEFGAVLDLYDTENSIFRSLCDEASLKRDDIIRIREAHGC